VSAVTETDAGQAEGRDPVELARALHANLQHVLLGTSDAVTIAVVAALSGGHLLIEDVPGVGKTVLARTLALSLGVELSRVQGHPDLLPSDVTGVSVYQASGNWEFRPGPVFAHVVLVDELNRTRRAPSPHSSSPWRRARYRSTARPGCSRTPPGARHPEPDRPARPRTRWSRASWTGSRFPRRSATPTR